MSAESHASAANAASSTTSRKETRGRPPSSGKYVGVRKAREELQRALQAAREEELTRSRIRAEIAERNARYEAGLPPMEPPLPPMCTREICGPKQLAAIGQDNSDEELKKKFPREIFRRLEAGVSRITQVAEKSLKGACVKELEEAVEVIVDEARNLRNISRSEENGRLQQEIKKLRRDYDELHRDFVDLKKKMRTKPIDAAPPAGPSAPSLVPPGTTGGIDVETLTANIIRQMGALVNARVEVIEARLPRERPFRPLLGGAKILPPAHLPADKTAIEVCEELPSVGAVPPVNGREQLLANDVASRTRSRTKTAAPAAKSAAAPTRTSVPPATVAAAASTNADSGTKSGKKKKKTNKEEESASAAPNPPALALPPPPADASAGWTEIVRRGRKKERASTQGAQPPPATDYWRQ